MLAQPQHLSTTVAASDLERALHAIGCAECAPASRGKATLEARLTLDAVSVSLKDYSPNGVLYLEDTAPLCSGFPELHLGGAEAWLLYEFARFVASTARDRGVSDTILFRMVDTEPIFSWGIYALIPQQHGFNMPGGGE